jgi:hypothetical protein
MFNIIPIKSPMTFIIEIEKSTLKFIWKQKRLQVAKAILSKKRCYNNQHQTILQSNSNKNSMILAQKTDMKTRGTEQRNRIWIHTAMPTLFLTKMPKTYDGDYTVSTNKCCCKKSLSACRKLKLNPYLSPCISINSKWNMDLNIRLESLKLVQERTGNPLEAIWIGMDFVNSTIAAQELWERMDKWDFIKLKSFCTTKEMVFKQKRPPQSWRKYLPAIYQTKDW